MKITYKNNKLEKICTDFSKAKKVYGNQIATKLIQRINELEASNNLYDMSQIRSARLHQLKGNRKEEYAIMLTGNYRLILTSTAGNIKLEKIEEARIEDIEDYH